MDFTTFLSSIEKIAIPIFLLFSIFFLVKVIDFIATKVKNEKTKMVLLKIEQFVLAAVKDVEQTLVPIYTANGQVLSPENATKLKEAALEKVNGFLGDQGKQEAQIILHFAEDQFKSFLSTQIEKGVFDLKTQAPA